MAPTVLGLHRAMRAWEYLRVEGVLVPAAEAGDVRAAWLVDGAGRPVDGARARLGPPPPGSPAGHHGFAISALGEDGLDLMACAIEVQTTHGTGVERLALQDHVAPVWPAEFPLLDRLQALVAAHPAPRVLEVGGRARSGVLHRDLLGPVAEYVGLDVLPGEGVDVVADAHRMSDVLGHERFDFACSYVVWEHLAMPWKVVVELNRVLVTGAYAYVMAPQTCGLHDLPWDFFRFSDSAFRALFAPETGFEVVEVVRAHPMHVLPFVATGLVAQDAEATAGFFTVAVLVRKTGPTTLEWAADPAGLLDAPYPE